jgi:hypothetical protein
MAGRRAWLIVALTVAGAWAAGCQGSPVEQLPGPGDSQFIWNVTPSTLRVRQGAAGTFAIRLDEKVNINSEVLLGVLGTLPPNSTAALVPEKMPATSRDASLTFRTTSQTQLGSYPLTITATEIGYPTTYVQPIQLEVVAGDDAPDFLLQVDPTAITLEPRRSGPTVTFRITPINGFGGTVDIAVDGLAVPPAPVVIAVPVTPSQITFAAGDQGQGGTFVPELAQLASYPPTWTLTVRAVSGMIVHTMTINITIRPR